ncbi:MAG: c-type cytochrome [Desulfuromonadales bacterium]
MKKFIALICVVVFVLVMAPAVFADAAKGQGVYMNFCASCHASGIAGAPKVGDKSAWAEHSAKGTEAMIQNAINGYQGSAGFMPARGGNSALTDEEVSSAVLYMLEQSK